MTIKKRLARSNRIMIIVPVAVTALMVLGGLGISLFSLETVYLPRLGLSLAQIHAASEIYESVFADFEAQLWIYVGAMLTIIVLSIILTNRYLTQFMFRHISEPLDILSDGVARIRSGNLEGHIIYEADDEFRPVCDAVNLMSDRLRESMEASQRQQQSRKELIAGMSHDLRSPLTSIRAYTEALLDGVARTPESQQRYLETIYSKEAEIEDMVERLFDFSKLDLNEYPTHIEQLDLRYEMQRAVENAAGEHVELTLSAPEPAFAMADREQLDRITRNVIDNSRKYRTGDMAHIEIQLLTQEGKVELLFSDDGPGVADEALPRLFDILYRTDPARRNPAGGSGLGLAIVREAAGQMGGTVTAERSRLGGLAIRIRLPAAKEEQ